MTRKAVPYSWEISQPAGNDEGTDISRYCSLGAPAVWQSTHHNLILSEPIAQ